MAIRKDRPSAALAIVGASVLALGLVASSSAYDWVTMTSFRNARKMRVINDSVYIATSGGLLVTADPSAPGRQFTNLNGLGTIDINDVIQAADGQVWVAGFGRLIKFDGVASERFPIIDNEGIWFNLFTLEDDGAFLWVGSDYGLILFSKVIDGGQIQDSYQMFDDLNPEPDVFDIALTGDSIWLATSSGLAVADRSNPIALKSPANWNGYTFGEYPELGTDTVRALSWFEDALYVGTAAGLFRLDAASDTLVRLSFAAGRQVRDLKVESDSLFVYTDAGLGVVKGGVVQSLATPGISSFPRTGATLGGRRWLGARSGGLFYSDQGTYREYLYVGLPDNDITDVTVTPDRLLTTLYRFKGPYELHDGEWVSRPIAVSSRAIAMEVDRHGRNYIGTFGGGMSRVGDTIARFTSVNSTLQEVVPGGDYVVCFDVAVVDNLFLGANFEPYGDSRIAIAPLDRMDTLAYWIRLGVGDGINGVQMVSVDYHDQALAAGSGLDGAFYYYLGPSLYNKSDDSVVHYHQNAANFRYRIISDVVRVVRFSPSGELWVGTNFGISRFDLGVERFVTMNLPAGFGPDITALEFDFRGNVWIGARNGLARLDGSSGQYEVFTAANSSLVSDDIFNLYLDPYTGNLYVCTPQGLSVILSTIGLPTSNLDSVYAFPNPYVVRSPDDLLNFNFARLARLRIFTIAGELVADRPEPVWNGRNDAGEPVASGVYLWVLTDNSGDVGRGKVLLIRE